MDAWLHVLDAVVELPAHLLREGGGEGLKALVHHPRHHGVPGGQGRHVAFALLREGAALAGGGIGGREEEEEHQEQPRHGEIDGARRGVGRETGRRLMSDPSHASSPRLLPQIFLALGAGGAESCAPEVAA